MRIEKVSAENFLGHKKTSIDVAPVTVLVGPNAAGKTSIGVDALSAVRYGRARGVLQKDASALTHAGEKRWAVEVTVDGQVIRRTATTCSHTQADLDRIFKGPRVWQALLDVGTFPALSPKDRQVFVADLTEADTSALVERLKALDATWEVIAAAKDGDLKKAHRLATEVRREADRHVAFLNSQVAVEPVDKEVETRGGKVPVSTLPITTLRQVESTIHAAMRGSDARKAERERQAKVRDRATAAQRDIDALPKATWTPDDVKAMERLLNSLPVARKPGDPALLKRREELAAKVESARADFMMANETVLLQESLLKKKGPCVMCGQAMDGAYARAKESLETFRVRREKAETEGTAAAKELNAVNRQIGEAERAADGEAETATKKIRDEIRALEERKRKADDLRTRRVQLDAVVAAAAELEPVPDDPPDQDRPALDASLERVRVALSARGVFDEAVRQRDEARGKVDAATKDAGRLADVEEAVRPDRAEGLGEALGRLNATLASCSRPIFGRDTAAVVVTPEWEIEVLGRPYGMASRSERYRAGALLSIALSGLAGLGVVVLDDADSLDERWRGELVRLLAGLHEAGELQTAIVVSAQYRRDALRPPPADFARMFWVEDGKASVVAPAAAMKA